MDGTCSQDLVATWHRTLIGMLHAHPSKAKGDTERYRLGEAASAGRDRDQSVLGIKNTREQCVYSQSQSAQSGNQCDNW